ncbi:MAG: ATP-binding protein [Thermodesulfobacteriota bacterium]
MLHNLFNIHQGFSPYIIPPFLGLLTTLGLALLAFIKGKGRKSNLLFACLCTIGVFLNIDVALMTIVTKGDIALKISRYDHLLLVYNIPIYLHFVHTFFSINKKRWLVPVAYLFSFSLMFFTQSQFYLIGSYRYYFGFFAKGGPLFYLFFSVNSLVLLYCLYLSYKQIKEEINPVKRNQIKYVFLGFGTYTILALLNVLPMSGIEIYPFGNFGFISMIILAFGVLKHDLLDMGFLIRKGMVYSSITAFLMAFYAFLIVAFDMIFKGFKISDSFLFPVFLFLIILFVFIPVKEKVQMVIDRIFFKGKYDYQKTLRDVSQAMRSILHIDEIVNRIIDTVINSMHVTSVSVVLWSEEEKAFRVHSVKGEFEKNVKEIELVPESPLIALLMSQKRELSKHDIEEGNEWIINKRECLRQLGYLHASLIVPMIFNNSVKGFIGLGYKKSGDLYTSEDMELLQTLANQSSISIENARSYRIIEDLNKNLEMKIQARTKELERALLEKEKTQEQLIRSESLAAVGQLVAGVAHELNNPLSSVSSLIQSTVQYLEDKDVKREYEGEIIDDLRFTLKELMRAKEIIASLLDISRQTQGYTEPVNINTVVKDALRVLYNQYKRYEVEIVEEFHEDIPEIKGNFANLGQVCLNIIKNSIQEVKGNAGNITLRTGFDQKSNRVIFECTDTGKGIPPSTIKDIFKPFFTTKEVGTGTGLGLYISHEIVKRHRGDIFVFSTPGKGTTFRVELPVDS